VLTAMKHIVTPIVKHVLHIILTALLLAPLAAPLAADGTGEAVAKPRPEPHAIVSLRVSAHLWMHAQRRAELIELLRQRRDTIEEVCFFTSFTHSVLPLESNCSIIPRD